MSLHLLNTATDKNVDLTAPDWRELSILDIAWALSQLNRFMGHARRPYSVAEHSLLVADIAQHDLRLDVHGQMAALMHDAHEVYCADLHPWTKHLLGWAWTNHEQMMERTVRTAYCLHTANDVHRDAIKLADKIALATELRDVKGGSVSDWGTRHGVRPVTRYRLDTPDRESAPWQYWREAFLQRFRTLETQRAAELQNGSTSQGLPARID